MFVRISNKKRLLDVEHLFVINQTVLMARLIQLKYMISINNDKIEVIIKLLLTMPLLMLITKVKVVRVINNATSRSITADLLEVDTSAKVPYFKN